MSGAIRVLLPPTAAHLAPRVLEAGASPIIDATGEAVPEVPEGAWVRTRPGRPAPGTGPVILAELGAPVPDRETWLESSVPRDVPGGFKGLVLKGREAGGLCGEEDGLVALARCSDPSRVILDAGVGPRTAAAAAALGANGVLLVEQHLGCPELALPVGLMRRLGLDDAEVTRLVQGIRVCASATAPVLRRLVLGEDDPWSLQARVWRTGDPAEQLWLMGQGLALARRLAERHGTLVALIAAYQEAWSTWPDVIRAATLAADARPVGTASQLQAAGTAAATGGIVGSGVLWEEAGWLGRPVHGGPVRAASATGCAVIADPQALEAARADLPKSRSSSRKAPRVEAIKTAAHAPPPQAGAVPAIAIVGLGCRFPGGSNSPEAFWNAIVGKKNAIGEVPSDRWDPALYWDADDTIPDKTYAKIGGFLVDFQFDSKAFRIPPNVARQVDPVQQITLMCVADALRDAGLKVDKRSDGREFDRSRCAVILGNSLGGEVSDKYAVRLAWPDVARRLLESPPFCDLNGDEQRSFLAQMEEAYKAGLPIVDEDSMPGELANVIAGRIANAFDLGGANFTVDAACASSMAALQSAMKSLQSGESDLVVTGGADRSMNIATYVKFCKIGALSPDHSAPFDASANGFVMGEGCGILLLKRYEDAERDGDKVYAVLRGIGASSDGKGKGITAPNLQGQVLAIKRAYEAAGFDPWDVDLVEAHGTSTVVGDKVEVEALNAVIGAGKRDGRGPIRIGSVKSMIGHLKSAAGAASVMKVALALHKGTLPPTINFRTGRTDVPFDIVPLKVQSEAEAWPATPHGLRRAGVSAFGFGGTNFHVVLESYGGQPLPASAPQLPPAHQTHVAPAPPPAARAVVVPTAARVEAAAAPQNTEIPSGLWATSGMTSADLLANLEALRDGRAAPFHASAPIRVAAAPADAAERKDQLDRSIASVKKGGNPDLLRARGIAYEDVPFDRKLAFLFTGQGSQYLDMGLDLAAEWRVVADTFAEADRILTPALGKPISDYIRLAPGEDADAKDDVLRRTEYSQPATLTMDVAILRLLVAYGAVPDMVAGHSLGEYGAAVAAGVMSFEQSLHAVSARGREMASIQIDDPGKMAGIAASSKVVDEVLADVDGYVIAANKNCPTQTVIAGASDAVEEACERFKAKGITVYPLPVSHAFHSAIVAPASSPLRGVLAKLGLRSPARPITTNVTGGYYPTGEGAVDGIIDLLAQQISSPVEWTAQMERMYEDDARVFVEIGPKRALSGFTVSILKRRPHRAIYTNHPKRGGVASLWDALAQLLALGVPLRAEPIATDRIDLFAQPEPRRATSQALAAYTELHPTQTEATPDLREGVLRIVAKATGYDAAELDLDHELEADLGIDTVKQAEVFGVVRSTYGISPDPSFSFADHKTLRAVIDWASSRTGARRLAVETVAPVADPPSATPVASADVVAAFLQRAAETGLAGLDATSFANALLPAVQGLLTAAFEAARLSRPEPERIRIIDAPPASPKAAASPAPKSIAAAARGAGLLKAQNLDGRIVCSGAAIGLPGGDDVFGADNFEAMLAGRNRISHIGTRTREFLDLGLVRLVKDPKTGQGSFLPVRHDDEVIRLAGIEGRFDLKDWGIDADLIEALDVTTRLSFAAGLEALRDAGIPLVRSYKTSASGKKVPQGWQLPESLRDGTGVIFGAAFPGYDRFARHLEDGGRDAEGRFDRRFLFQVLAMGHSQFAQLIGARGPNTCLNAACASSTQALAIAEDWIRVGRCERVVVIGADDVTSDALLPWIGGGFMAAGAASTHDVVEETALPFDRRRHGLVLGMGAVAVVVETAASAAQRSVIPLAEQLGAVIVNSAFHGTRLDVSHIATVMKRLVDDVCRSEGVTVAEMAEHTFFMSHETYTPARGGSAAAEIEALRAAFGASASRVVVTNTKGYTGHPMGAGIEDGVLLKALQYGVVPPVANLREPDEQLGDLRLSRGERGDFRYAVRLAAGFGSQLAITVHKAAARGDHRVVDPAARASWLSEVTGFAHTEERVEQRTLRVFEAAVDKPSDLRPDHSPAHLASRTPSAQPAPKKASVSAITTRPAPQSAPPLEPMKTVPPNRKAPVDYDALLADLIRVVATKTGYETAEIEPEFELEADLGVDTVKQAEILSELTERYGLQRDEDFRIADYPTLSALAGYLMGRAAGVGSDAVRSSMAPAPDRSTTPAPAEPTAARPTPATPPLATGAGPSAPVVVASVPEGDPSDVLPELMALVAGKTGYDVSELDPSFELEADLGIDTVKQAEILSEITEKHGLERDEAFRLSDYPTLERLAAYVAGRKAAPSSPGRPPSKPRAGAPVVPTAEVEETEASWPSSERTPVAALPRLASRPSPVPPKDIDGGATYEQTLAELLEVVAVRTGYDVSDLEPSFELEADLGVDTVKQAEILSALQARFSLDREDGFRPAEYHTLDRLARYLHSRRALIGSAPADEDEDAVRPIERVFVAEEFDLSPALTDEELLVANHVKLPASFRLRRPALETSPATATVQLDGRSVGVLGDGPLARALVEALAARGATTDSEPTVVIDTDDDVLRSFAHAKARESARPEVWITVTRLGALSDGDFGLPRAFTDGSRAGFTKSLGREWEQTAAAVVDVHPATPHSDAANVVCDELAAMLSDPRRADPEVFYDPAGVRHRVRLVTEEAPAPLPLQGAPVVLLTGGGRGITARIAKEFARRGKVKLALVGRAALPSEPLDEAAAKDRARNQLKELGQKVTPAKVEAALEPLRRGDEVRRNIEELTAAGAEVRYVQADLASAEGARRVVQEVTASLGPIDVLIHGAGVEESRLIAEKDDAAFHRVFDGKAVGGRALFEAVPAACFVVGMGSVAGRFGNAGQVDYAAANEALARMCHARPSSLHIAWTAWDDVGMAVRGGMRTLLSTRGVDLLPADAGASVLCDLVGARVSGELVCAGALGDFEGGASEHPLLDSLRIEDGVAHGVRALSKQSDPWILDHAIDGVPVLPGVIGLEMMAATAAALFPDLAYVGARNLRFNAPVKVHRDEVTTVAVEAQLSRPGEARVRLVSTRTLKTGRVRSTEHFSTTLRFGLPSPSESLPSAFLPDEGVDATGIYRRFFHGPKFQVLHQVFGVSADGLVGEGRVVEADIAAGLMTAPLVLEAAFQAAGLHRMIVAHTMGLPLEVEELELFARPTDGEPLSIMVQLDADTYHIDVDAVSGPILRVRGFTMVEKGPVPPGDRFPGPAERPTCFPARPTRARPNGSTVAEAHADEDPSTLLTELELAELRNRGTARRVQDRVAGRMAAKRALAALTGLDPLQMRVISLPSGEPQCVVPGHPDVRVSISHKDGRAIAVAVAAGRVGVDLERVEARDASFAQTWLTDGEQQRFTAPTDQTTTWAVKEAVLKWLGTGLKLSPHDVEVLRIGRDDAEVELRGEALARYEALGEPGLGIQVRRLQPAAEADALDVLVTVRSAA